MELQSIKSSYARWAPIYDKTFGAMTGVGRRTAVGYINARNVKNVLEVGVGTGLALPIYQNDIAVTGVDFSEDMLARAQEKAVELGLSHVKSLKQMDARDLQFPDGCFDVVAAMHIISVVPEPERFTAPFANLLGWHSDFEIETVLKQPDLVVIEKRSLPPMGMMTFLVFQKN